MNAKTKKRIKNSIVLLHLNNNSFKTWTRRNLSELKNKVSQLIAMSFRLKSIKECKGVNLVITFL